jgi:transposase
MAGSLLHLELGLPEAWLPDETLFSLCSRYHRASGNQLAAVTCKALFGHARQGCAHDFPAHLNHFVQVAGPALGSVAQILDEHTILPLYLRFSSRELSRRVRQAAEQGSAARLKADLGLLAGRFRANHPLKACPKCVVEDSRDFSTAYWHREHQFPGVWVCMRHRCALQPSDMKATGVGRFDWTLPDPARLRPQAAADPPTPATMKLANMVLAVVRTDDFALSADTLGLVHRLALSRRGLLRPGPQAHLNHAAAGGQYIDFIRGLAAFDELAGLPGTPESAAAEIARLTAQSPTGAHPLRHLALASWLFDSPDDFVQQCCSVDRGEASRPSGVKTVRPVDVHQDARKEAFLALVRGGRSVSGAAREIGVQPQTGMAWAAAHGIPTARRPKLLEAHQRQRMISMLRKGSDKPAVAEAGGVSVQTVTTLLRTEVGLREAWRQAQFSSAQARHRKRWQQALGRDPAAGIRSARLLEPAAYAWLNRHDHSWLAECNDRFRVGTPTQHHRVDWDARDHDLAEQVRRMGLEIATANPDRKVKLWHVYQRLPRLKALLSRIDRLPLTRAAITAVTSAPALESSRGMIASGTSRPDLWS